MLKLTLLMIACRVNETKGTKKIKENKKSAGRQLTLKRECEKIKKDTNIQVSYNTSIRSYFLRSLLFNSIH